MADDLGGGDREDGRHGPELEAFIPLFPRADLTDPAAARKNLGIDAGSFPGVWRSDQEGTPSVGNRAYDDLETYRPSMPQLGRLTGWQPRRRNWKG
jgi:hypothetical protein